MNQEKMVVLVMRNKVFKMQKLGRSIHSRWV